MPSAITFPLQQWRADMESAIDVVCETGKVLLATHRQASPEADAAAGKWGLEEKLEQEREALTNILARMEKTLVGTGSLERALREAIGSARYSEPLETQVVRDTGVLATALSGLEAEFSDVRHCALDLLRWSSRSGRVDGSDLPENYRQSYAKLISYAPDFDELWAGIGAEVEALDRLTHGAPSVRTLMTTIDQHRSMRLRMRAFLKSVISPPYELTFEETEGFLADWESYSAAAQAALATEFNDCCQLLLYSRTAFEEKVDTIRPELAGDLEASLRLLPVGHDRILFLADEDPVFEQITITLLRLVPSRRFEAAKEEIVDSLYREFLLP